MTVISKLSDRENLLSKAILLLTMNMGTMDQKKLQFELFNRGIFVDKPLLKQCIAVMIENKQIQLIQKPDVKLTEPIQEENS
jgi:hypothetical protein